MKKLTIKIDDIAIMGLLNAWWNGAEFHHQTVDELVILKFSRKGPLNKDRVVNWLSMMAAKDRS